MPHYLAAATAFEDRIRNVVAGTLRLEEDLLSILNLTLRREISNVLTLLDDKSLALAIRKNVFRKEAFEELVVVRYEPMLHHVVFQLLWDEHAANDVVQEVYVKILANLDDWNFDPDRPFGPWLKQVGFNTCLDHLRRQRKLRFGCRVELTSREADPSSWAEATELEARLTGAIGRLNPRYQAVLKAHLAGHDVADIARAFGETPGNISVILHRARVRLRELCELTVRARPRRKKAPAESRR